MCYEDPFNWGKYIELAEELLNRSRNYNKPINSIDRECLERNVISRSYYGAFCLSRNLAYEENWISDKYDEQKNYHHLLQEIFKKPNEHIDSKVINNYSINTLKRIGKRLEKMRRARNRADYKDQYPSYMDLCYKRESEKGIEFAKYIKNQLKDIAS